MEFLIGQHSLFIAGFGQAFFYLHQFGSAVPIFSALLFLALPWALVFILFYHDPAYLSASFIRRWWLRAACASALLTVIAEVIWMIGLMPPPTEDHRIAADVLVQVLMNLVWLSFIPMIRDYKNNPELWP